MTQLMLTKAEAEEKLETAIGILCEVGNGTRDEDLRDALHILLEFRDRYFKSAFLPREMPHNN